MEEYGLKIIQMESVLHLVLPYQHLRIKNKNDMSLKNNRVTFRSYICGKSLEILYLLLTHKGFQINKQEHNYTHIR